MEYGIHIVILVLIYATLATSLNLLAGETGLLSFGQAAFFGAGAYTSALLAVHAGLPFVAAFLSSVCAAVVLSLLLSIPSLWLNRDHFVLATFGFSIIITGVLTNWTTLTGGADGVTGVPAPGVFGWQARSELGVLAVAVVVAAAAHLVIALILRSPFGRVLRAIREDESVVEICGRNPARFKVVAFAVAAAVAGAAGSVYAHFMGFIDPSGFTILESILVVSMVILGGAGTLWGPVLGAAALVSLPEFLRFVGMPSSVAAQLRQLLYGVGLILMMMLRPQGLIGKHAFGR